MIVVFTANRQGGIVQFTEQIIETLQASNNPIVGYFPDGSIVSNKCDGAKFYKKVRSVSGSSKSISNIVTEILSEHPEMVLFTDNSILSSQVLLRVCKFVKVAICVHDPNSHPTHSLFDKLVKNPIARFYAYHAHKKADAIVLMSENSKSEYERKFEQFADKTRVLLLGAHVPKALPSKPLENDLTDYLLFFGRMDLYKGINRLLVAYNSPQCKGAPQLVIAGNGKLSKSEEELIGMNSRVTLIKRYIKDEEMLWLFSNAKAVVLPYIEASQSGVLPMAYHYGLPVIVSNLPGLTEFVIEGETGFIFEQTDQLADILASMGTRNIEDMKNAISVYYQQKFNWESNIKSCFDGII